MGAINEIRSSTKLVTLKDKLISRYVVQDEVFTVLKQTLRLSAGVVSVAYKTVGRRIFRVVEVLGSRSFSHFWYLCLSQTSKFIDWLINNAPHRNVSFMVCVAISFLHFMLLPYYLFAIHGYWTWESMQAFCISVLSEQWTNRWRSLSRSTSYCFGLISAIHIAPLCCYYGRGSLVVSYTY